MSDAPGPSGAPGPADGATARAPRPRAVETLDAALADWLSTFTAPGELAGEMADACATAAAWPAAVAAVAAREAGWGDVDAMAWGVAVGAQAGAIEAAGRSLAEGPGSMADEAGSAGGHGTDLAARGPALSLLAADALVAAAHEALSSLDPDRLAAALGALERVFGDGGPWRAIPDGAVPPARATVPLALAILGEASPSDDLAALAREARGGSPAGA